LPTRIYGEPAEFHVVSEEIVPLTLVDAIAAGQGNNPEMKTKLKKNLLT
jgi:hypothetical protein